MVDMNHLPEQNRTDTSSVPRPMWTEEVGLQTVDAAGLVGHVRIYLAGLSAARIALLDTGSCTEFSGTDYLDCLTQARRQLERDGRLLCCQGARPNVHPSGQLRQFTNGRQAYVRRPGPSSAATETVDIFAPASPEDIVNLDDQRTAVIDSWNARHPANQL
ncbi:MULTISPECIES: hypothetical protein [Streptomycetaceae]|uniref:hypothetical protein n=1 Tax=Streptomycetaceae TaxID=2062 RepID=UPI0006AE0A09|nr:hypothetical protein [Streptomyces sp. XY431]